MLRRQGIWNKQVHDFTTSTLGTKQKKKERWDGDDEQET